MTRSLARPTRSNSKLRQLEEAGTRAAGCKNSMLVKRLIEPYCRVHKFRIVRNNISRRLFRLIAFREVWKIWAQMVLTIVDAKTFLLQCYSTTVAYLATCKFRTHSLGISAGLDMTVYMRSGICLSSKIMVQDIRFRYERSRLARPPVHSAWSYIHPIIRA